MGVSLDFTTSGDVRLTVKYSSPWWMAPEHDSEAMLRRCRSIDISTALTASPLGPYNMRHEL